MAYGTRLNNYAVKAGVLGVGYGARQLLKHTTPIYPRRNTRSAMQTMVHARRVKKPNSRSFRTKLMNTQPAKHYEGSTTTALTHGTVQCMNPTGGIVQGDTNAQRDGDFVHLAALKIKGIFQTAAATGAYSYRVIVGYSGEEYNLPTVLGTGLTIAEVFLPNTTGNWIVNGIINPKAFTSIYDETIDINSEIAAATTLSSFSCTVPLDKKFPYQSAASTFGKDKNLYIIVVSAINGGVTGVTSTGLTVFSYDLIFKGI